MKQIFFACFVMLISGCGPIIEKPPNQQYVDPQVFALHELFKALNIDIPPTLEAMNTYAQKNWLRKPGEERWQMGTSEYQAMAIKLEPVLKKIGVLDEVFPSRINTDYAIVLGAAVFRMRVRMQHLMHLVDTGKLIPKKIVVLTGDRPLDPNIEGEKELLDARFICKGWKCLEKLPSNESEAAQFVWKQLSKSRKVEQVPIQFVPTPMIQKGDKCVRPTAPDIIETWMRMSPELGHIVAISNNPYVLFQNKSMKAPLIKAGWFEGGGTLESVGAASTEKSNISVQLDNVARYMYSMLQTQKVAASR